MGKLLETVKGLSFVNISGVQYLGNVKPTEKGNELTSAVDISEETSFSGAIKKWIRANNIDELEDMTSEGMGASFVEKKFKPKQIMELTAIVADAEYKMKYALNKLQNDSIV